MMAIINTPAGITTAIMILSFVVNPEEDCCFALSDVVAFPPVVPAVEDFFEVVIGVAIAFVVKGVTAIV